MGEDTRTTWVVYSVEQGRWQGYMTEAEAIELAAAWTEHNGGMFDAETLESAQRRALDFKLGAASLVTSP